MKNKQYSWKKKTLEAHGDNKRKWKNNNKKKKNKSGEEPILLY